MDRVEQKKKRVRKGNRPFYMILLVIGLYVAWVFVDQQMRLHALAEQEEIYKNKVEDLKQEIARREEEVKSANTPEFIEKVAREQLKMVKPNEIIYIDMHKSKNSQ